MSENYGMTTQFGFVWGPVGVTRQTTLPEGRRVVQIRTDHRTLDVYVSATGRSVRVFDGTTELTATPRADGRPGEDTAA